jgi:hypothetical protein
MNLRESKRLACRMAPRSRERALRESRKTKRNQHLNVTK